MDGNGFYTLEKILDLAAFRHRILASNVANADTPGYRAKDIVFSRELEKALEGTSSRVEVVDAPTTLPSRDGNTVNVEIEMAKIAENTLTYDTAIRILEKKIKMMKDVIKGGR